MREGGFYFFKVGVSRFDAGGNLDVGGDDEQLIFLWGLNGRAAFSLLLG
jgi:hypothetical protein